MATSKDEASSSGNDRDLIGYAQNVPKVGWPNNALLAVSFVVNYEEGSERNSLDGDLDLETLVESRYVVPAGAREFATESSYEYGSRVGVWRVLDAFEEYDVKPSIFASAVALERNPAVAKRVRDRQYEVVGHGYRWLAPIGLEPEEEARQVDAAISRIRELTGYSIQGWYTRPPKTENTRQTLVDAGLTYDCDSFNDDTPYFVGVNGRPFLVLPYSLDVNDIRFWKGQLFSTQDFVSYACESFDTLYAEGLTQTRMLSIGLHPRIIGRPGRISGLRRVLEYVTSHERVWVAGRDSIARHWLEHAPTTPAG